MKASEGRPGRTFVLRLEDGDRLPDCLERFASERDLRVAWAVLFGGIGSGEVVVGPRDSDERPPEPMRLPLDGAHECLGVGLVAPDSEGKPHLHMHSALGRSGKTTTGCIRPGVKAWIVCEVILQEILDANISRSVDPELGFALLTVKE